MRWIGCHFFTPRLVQISIFYGPWNCHLFQLIGHFMSTHIWVDLECPTFGPYFFTTTVTQILMFFGTWNCLLFQLKVAFRVYSYLSGCGMPYFFFGPSFFHSNTPYNFDVFPNMKLSLLQLIGHFVSTHIWVDSECPTFFWPVIF